MTSILTGARPPADRQSALEWSEGKHFSKASLDSPPRTQADWSAWSLPKQKNGWLKCCFTSTETVGLLGTGAQDVHLDFHTAPEFEVKEATSPRSMNLHAWVLALCFEFFVEPRPT